MACNCNVKNIHYKSAQTAYNNADQTFAAERRLPRQRPRHVSHQL